MKPRKQVIDGKQQCIGCQEWLPLECFTKRSRSTTGRYWRCRKCARTVKLGGMTPSERTQAWIKANPQRYRELSRLSRMRVRFDARRLEARREQVRRYYEANREKMIRSNRAWRRDNPWVMAADRGRSLVRLTVSGMLEGGLKFQELVGCNGIELRRHLQEHWLEGMGWHNFGRGGWTIGHVVACGKFGKRLESQDGMKECFHWSNLRPEWERSNLVKFTYSELTPAQKQLEGLG